MQTIINYFMDNPNLLIAIIVFVFCVIIGFFADQYLKKQSNINKAIEKKEEDNKTNETTSYEKNFDSNIKTNSSAELKENVSFNNNSLEGNLNVIQQNTNTNQNFSENQNIGDNQNIQVEQNSSINQNSMNQNINSIENNDISYINNDDNFNNLF